ncbi:MAG TPA: hypothetical protein VH370_19610 [Humisphaera sp.]|jgi:hypothetical protein|nr:hypothetical protein [Humisphaera sp.]
MTQISPTRVVERIDDWIVRLNDLYDTLDTWLETIPHDRVVRSAVRQTIEPQMRRSKVAPRKLPTYTIFRNGNRIAFVPSVLWMAGANGRIDVTTDSREHILVDRGTDEHVGKWQIVVDDYKRLLIPFNKAQLARLVGEEG